MLLRHVIDAQIVEAVDRMLAQLALASGREERQRIASEALHDAAKLGYEMAARGYDPRDDDREE